MIWAAGTRANELRTGCTKAHATGNRGKRRLFGASIPTYCDSDVANFRDQDGKPLPGLAPVAKQQGKFVARLIRKRIEGHAESPSFQYKNWGSMAVIGRSQAIGDFGTVRVKGFIAWLGWSLVHLMLLVDFRSRLTVYINWAWSWFTHGRGARLLTGRQVRSAIPIRAKVKTFNARA